MGARVGCPVGVVGIVVEGIADVVLLGRRVEYI